MLNFIQKLFAKIPQALRWPLMVFTAAALVLLLWLYGVKAWNGVGNFMYHHSENDARKEVDQVKAEIDKQKQVVNELKEVARQALAAYESSKLVIKEMEAQRVIAEKELADKRKNTDQKLAAYEAALNARPTVTGPQSTDEMCKRAAALGISVTCQ